MHFLQILGFLLQRLIPSHTELLMGFYVMILELYHQIEFLIYFLGGSYVVAEETTPTLNIGAGTTFWVKPNYGINLQFMYKFSEDRFKSQYSHFYPSIGFVYSFKSRNLNPRLWDRKH